MGRSVALHARRAQDHPQRRLGAGPSFAQHLGVRAAGQQAQGERQQYRVVGDADDREEIRDQVDRQRQVGENDPKPRAPRQVDAGVTGQTPDQNEAIGDEAGDGTGVLAAAGGEESGDGDRVEADDDQQQPPWPEVDRDAAAIAI